MTQPSLKSSDETEVQLLWRLAGCNIVDVPLRDGMTPSGFVPQPRANVERTLAVSSSNVKSVLTTHFSSGVTAPVRLIAPTGEGKTTQFPSLMASLLSSLRTTRARVLVIEPTAYLARQAADYCKKTLRYDVACDNGSGSFPASAPVVYTDLSTAHGRLLSADAYVSLLGAIILDEAHDTSALSYVMRCALYTQASGTFVFLTSATFEARNAEFSRSMHTVGSTPVTALTVDSFVNGAVECAVSPSSLGNRCLVFCPDDRSVDTVLSYYRSHGVVYTAALYTHSTLKDYAAVYSSLVSWRGYAAVVALCGADFGFTLPVDSVLDFSVKTTIWYDISKARFSLKSRNLTPAERVQRKGRVGRLDAGMYYYADVTLARPMDIEPAQKFFAYAMLRLYGFQPMAEFSAVAKIMDPLSPLACYHIVTSRLHPALVRCFLDDSGKFYKQCAPWFSTFAAPSATIRVSDALLDVGTSWPEHSRLVAIECPITRLPFDPTGLFEAQVYALYCSMRDYVEPVMQRKPVVATPLPYSEPMAIPDFVCFDAQPAISAASERAKPVVSRSQSVPIHTYDVPQKLSFDSVASLAPVTRVGDVESMLLGFYMLPQSSVAIERCLTADAAAIARVKSMLKGTLRLETMNHQDIRLLKQAYCAYWNQLTGRYVAYQAMIDGYKVSLRTNFRVWLSPGAFVTMLKARFDAGTTRRKLVMLRAAAANFFQRQQHIYMVCPRTQRGPGYKMHDNQVSLRQGVRSKDLDVLLGFSTNMQYYQHANRFVCHDIMATLAHVEYVDSVDRTVFDDGLTLDAVETQLPPRYLRTPIFGEYVACVYKMHCQFFVSDAAVIHRVNDTVGMAFIVMPPGSSGAAVVSLDDYAVVGFHSSYDSLLRVSYFVIV